MEQERADGRWRYVYYPQEMFAKEYPEGFGELYNLGSDPWEMANLWSLPEHQQKVRQMHSALMDWLVTTTHPRTVNCSRTPVGRQSRPRYGCRVNEDGKIHPQNLRDLRNRNYL